MMKVLRFNFILVVCMLLFYKVSAQAPEVTDFSPKDNATNVSVTVDLAIFFDQSVEIGEGTITIRNQSDGSIFEEINVPAEDTVDMLFDNIVQVQTKNFALASSYYVEVSEGAFVNLSGEPLAGISDPTRWNFTTGCGQAPTNITATSITDISATLSWNLINGAGSYDIQIGTGEIINVIGNAYEATNLSPDTPYSFKVRTKCANGSFSAWSKAVTFRTAKACEDIIPGGLNALFVRESSAVLSWSALNVSEYQVHIFGLGYFDADTNSFLIDNLKAGVKYAWRVKAKCSDSTYSEFASYSHFITTVPGCETTVPINQRVNEAEISGESATLRWDATIGAADYRVHVYGRGTFTASTNSLTVNGLAPGMTYAWRVMSRCSNDLTSEYSDYNRFTTTTPNCDPITPIPLQVNQEEVTDQSAVLAWEPVPGVGGYQVHVFGVGNFNTTATSFQVNGLTPGKLYSWRIKSTCTKDVGGEFSSYLRFVTDVPGCEATAPLNLVANEAEITTQSAMLRWDAVEGAVGYNVHVYGVGTFYPITNSLEVTGLTPGKRYAWRVKSKCSADLGSDWTSYSRFTTETEMMALSENKMFNSYESKGSNEDNSEYQLNLTLYPIPSTDVVNVSLETGYDDRITSIVVTNSQGIIVKRLDDISSQHEAVSLREHGSGIFFVGIMVNGTHYEVRKVIIQ